MYINLIKLSKSDPASFSRTNIDKRVNLLDSAPDEELFTRVKDNEDDWKAHPSLYYAVIEQLQKRGIIPRV